MRGIKPRLQNSVRHPISLSLPRTRFSVAANKLWLQRHLGSKPVARSPLT